MSQDAPLDTPLDTPVAFFIFNRPLQTARVFSRIAQARPRQLFLIADGARHEGEHEACSAARALASEIDWDCDVQFNFSDTNLGCRRRMSSGINWVFSQVDRAILLEDDCLPEMTFFPYCQELLERYHDEPRVMTIGGVNFQFGVRHTPHSYYFSGLHHMWGWATWRRAWAHYDVEMKQWPFVVNTDFTAGLVPPETTAAHKKALAQTYEGKIDTWDFQWTFACWMRRAYCVLPTVNLISNIGYGPAATHCKKPDVHMSIPTEPLALPMNHPPRVDLCAQADQAYARHLRQAA